MRVVHQLLLVGLVVCGGGGALGDGTPLFDYSGCGTDKGCFGLVDGCVENRDCEAVFSYRGVSADVYEFQVSGPAAGYVAMGLNKMTDKMAYGVAFVCHVVDGSEAQVNMYNMNAQNVDGVKLNKEEDPSYGILNSNYTSQGRFAYALRIRTHILTYKKDNICRNRCPAFCQHRLDSLTHHRCWTPHHSHPEALRRRSPEHQIIPRLTTKAKY